MEDKFCKDCKHSRFLNRFFNPARLWYCYRDYNIKTIPNEDYLMQGPPKEITKKCGKKFCSSQRDGNYKDYCGKEGKFFEPREKK